MRAKDDFPGSLNKKPPEGLNRFNQPYTVLIVDDSFTMRKIVGQHLKSEAYIICGEAGDGEEAITKYKELAPDIVTLDINMPKMNGIEALQRIIDYDKHARIVMLTSEGQKQVVVDAIAKGAKGYIVKPPQRANVCAKIKAALAEE